MKISILEDILVEINPEDDNCISKSDEYEL
jgi:hypothetical protein